MSTFLPVMCAASQSRARRWLLASYGHPSSNQDAEGDTKKDVVERKAKAHAHGNTHADGRLTFLPISQVGSRIPSSTHHNTADVDRDPTTAGRRFNVRAYGSRGCAAFSYHSRAGYY